MSEAKPVFDLDAYDWIDTVWFQAAPYGDVMIMLVMEGGEWRIHGRVRNYRDDKVFDSDDTKHVFTAKGEREELRQRTRKLLQIAREHIADLVDDDEVVVGGNVNKFMEVLKEQPWAHMQVKEPEAPTEEEFLQ